MIYPPGAIRPAALDLRSNRRFAYGVCEYDLHILLANGYRPVCERFTMARLVPEIILKSACRKYPTVDAESDGKSYNLTTRTFLEIACQTGSGTLFSFNRGNRILKRKIKNNCLTNRSGGLFLSPADFNRKLANQSR